LPDGQENFGTGDGMNIRAYLLNVRGWDAEGHSPEDLKEIIDNGSDFWPPGQAGEVGEGLRPDSTECIMVLCIRAEPLRRLIGLHVNCMNGYDIDDLKRAEAISVRMKKNFGV